ncbi:MFS transporter [Trinickia sp. NRRL B-1857]|uniref:MFS transporter n=1 Tax=Trinickia sp. NRRL B-1857 TaxID=3162879 RepID=UPI003D2BBE16
MIKKRVYFSLPRQFYLFQGGIIFGYFALRLMLLGTSWWCLQQTHSTVALGSVLSAIVLLELLTGPLAAPLGDRFGAKLVKLTFLIQILCLLALGSAALLLKTFSPLAVVPLLVIAQLADSARDPLADSLLPQLIGSEGLVDGERIRRALGTASRILGPVVGGAVTALMGPPVTLYLAAFAFCVGAYMCAVSGAGRQSGADDAHDSSQSSPPSASWMHELVRGFRSVIAIRTELAIALGNAFLMVGVSTFMLIALPQLAQETHGAWVMGAVDGAFGFGVFTAATLAVKRLNLKIGRYRTVVMGLLLHVAAFAVLFTGPKIVMLLVVGGYVLGFASVPVATNLTALRLQATPPDYRTRIIANTMFISSIFLPGALYAAGWISRSLGVGALLGAVLSSAVVATLIIPYAPHLKSLLRKEKTEGNSEYVTLFPKAFGNQ